ncbi:MAG: PAS domain-containing protein [Bacteroidetes bacterium]|nr:MAG: PAS domain-containing protein [Bacteroidota bacterium]
MAKTLNFSEQDAFRVLDDAPEVVLDQADFGIIKMTRKGEVMHYNPYESALAGIAPQDALGKNFFTQIAPCTNNFMVAARFMQEEEPVDETIPYVFTYKMTPTKVTLRLLAPRGEDHVYLLVKKE